MGDVDINIKNFLKINSVFAQLFSQGVYGGEVEIDPDKLQELDTAVQDTVRLPGGQLKNVERLRDVQKVAMLFDGRIEFQVILGAEGQAGVNYYMPVRCMELDALAYSYQCRQIARKAKENKELKKYADGVPKGTKIMPTVSLVFYVGKEPWDGPESVYDMLDVPEEIKEWMRKTAPDYRMNLIDARHMSDEEIDRFTGDLRALLLMLRERFDREKLRSAVACHRETWYTLSVIKNDKRYMEYIDSISEEEMERGVNMDAALDYIEKEGRKEGRKEGEALVNRLGILLFEAGREREFMNSLSDEKLQKELFMEFGLKR